MSRVQIDFPDKFLDELHKRQDESGATIRFMVLQALRKEWGWPDDAMPTDRRRVRRDVSARPRNPFEEEIRAAQRAPEPVTAVNEIDLEDW